MLSQMSFNELMAMEEKARAAGDVDMLLKIAREVRDRRFNRANILPILNPGKGNVKYI